MQQKLGSWVIPKVDKIKQGKRFDEYVHLNKLYNSGKIGIQFTVYKIISM